MSESENEGMDPDLQSLEATSQRLTNAVLDMSKRLNTTEKIQVELGEQQALMRQQMVTNRRQRNTNIYLILSLVLDVVLSAGLGLAAWRIDHNADSISEVQRRTSVEVLCPQYVLWLDLVKASSGRPNQTPEQKQTAADFTRVFQKGYDDLNCSDAVGP